MNINKLTFIMVFLLFLAFIPLLSPVSAYQGITVKGESAIASASSFCDEYTDINFAPADAFDGNPEKPWMSAGPLKSGSEEWVKLSFIKPVRMAGLRISPGFGRGQELFYNYARLKKFSVVLEMSNGKTETHTYVRRLDDSPSKDMLIIFSTEPVIKSFTLNILEVYSGKEGSNPLIGDIEPLIIKDGRIQSESWIASEGIVFLKTVRSADSAFNYVLPDQNVLFQRIVHAGNPLEQPQDIKKTNTYTKKDLQATYSIWESFCQNLSYDFQFNLYDCVNYIWKDDKKGLAYLDIFGSETADVMNSYTLAFDRREVREKITKKIKKKDEETGEEKEETQTLEITVMKPVIREITMISDIYTP